MPPAVKYFPSSKAFRAWLEKNHGFAAELKVGYYKRATGKPSLTWQESVDEALCFGWIDGVRHTVDEERYTIRFTPRRPGSRWSAINVSRVKALTKLGLMKPAGLAAYEQRTTDKTGTYSYEQRHRAVFEPDHLAEFQANAEAFTFFQAQPPSYRKIITFWVCDAKKPETRLKRLRSLIERSAARRRVI
jgi:uncharacterized protein YdeI (YjbR/CyaY-like superfamily)